MRRSLLLHRDFEGCLVRVVGPPPEEQDDEAAAPDAALSASGIYFLPGAAGQLRRGNLVLTVASVLAPFLRQPFSGRALSTETVAPHGRVRRRQQRRFLLDGAHITVSLEHPAQRGRGGDRGGGGPPTWHRARVVDIFDVARVKHLASRISGDPESSPMDNANGVNFSTLAVLELITWPRPQGAPSLVSNASASSMFRSQNVRPPLRPPVQLDGQFNSAGSLLLSSASLPSDRMRIERGQPLHILSSPFGLISPAVFRNTLSTGTVSNIVRARRASPRRIHPGERPSREQEEQEQEKTPALLLTDAAVFPGSYGGAAMTPDGVLCGIVSSPLKRKNGSYVELACVIPLNHYPILRRLDERRSMRVSSSPTAGTARVVDSTNHMQKSLVCVRVGTSWGSGIVISEQGHILTCAHLIQPTLSERNLKKIGKRYYMKKSDSPHSVRTLRTRHRVMIRFDAPTETFSGGTETMWHVASVLFCSRGTLDLACLKLDGVLPRNVIPADFAATESADGEFEQGSSAIVLGHALFDPQHNLPATVAVGSVAKLIPYHGLPMILQTSASVFRGDSGGMIVSGETGRLLGMITSNARQADSGIIPKLNFSIPSTLLPPRVGGADGLHITRMFEDWFLAFERLSMEPELERLWDLQNTEEAEIARVDREAVINVDDFLNRSRNSEDSRSRL